MILTDKDIFTAISKGAIKIDPFEESRMNPNSYNLTLNEKLLVYTDPILDCKKQPNTFTTKITETGFTLFPMSVYIAMTNEYTETHEYVPLIEGRSSLARLGIFVHATAGFGDVGFCGNWTLEISVIKPVIIYPNIEICQIYYHAITSQPERRYVGKYQNSREPRASELYKEFET